MKNPKYKLGDIMQRYYAEILITEIISTKKGYKYKLRYIKGLLDGLNGVIKTDKELNRDYKRIGNIFVKKK